jgi:hypothetical protein
VAGPDIFISYSREERTAARHFADSFKNEGFAVWWDAVLRSGQTFDEVIERELRAAKAVVVLWSPRSVTSRWVRAEATLADRGNKLVPVIIQPCTLPIIFELTQAADLSTWSGDTSDVRWRDLISDLRRLVGNDDAEAPSPVPAPSPPPATAQTDELLAALSRIAGPAGALSKPTEQEEQVTRFYRQADQERQVEGEQFHVLSRLDSASKDSRYVVNSTGLTIGRAAPADIIVASPGVSRAHCLIEFAAGKLRVTDLNSTNGTYVDDERVKQSAILPVGSILRVGDVAFEHMVCPRTEAQPGSDAIGLGIADSPSLNRFAS